MSRIPVAASCGVIRLTPLLISGHVTIARRQADALRGIVPGILEMACPLISLVVPVFNVIENLGPFFARVNPVLANLGDGYRFEFVFTDNHSTDGTFDRLAEIARTDPRVRAFRLSRNFGYQRSILTGYKHARGDAVIQLDVDLQDPPELLETFLHHWCDGYKVVYGVRRTRQESRLL